MVDKEYLHPAEVELAIARALEKQHEKLLKDLPEHMKPIMYEVAETTTTRLGKLLGVDFANVDSVKYFNKVFSYAEDKMVKEFDTRAKIKTTVIRVILATGIGALLLKFGIKVF